MKRAWITVLLLCVLGAGAFGQATGFGSGGAAGILLQGGDPSQLTQRIMSSTRYKLTPGDIYALTLTMQAATATYRLVLQENFDLQVPNIESINAKGMYFADLRTLIIQRLKKAYPYADFISLTLESPARFDVTVFGGVQTPGTVTVNATQRVSDALILAGRLVAGATYRAVSLVRNETRISVDLFRYRLDGASEQNPYLEPGDRIYVPLAGTMVTLSGQVRYPGVFEMVQGETLADLIGFAGGLLPDANTGQIEVAGRTAGGSVSRRTVAFSAAGSATLGNGDAVRISSRIQTTAVVLVTGAIFGAPVAADKPAAVPLVPVAVSVPWTPDMTVLSVLEALGGPTPYADAANATVVRKATGLSTRIDADALWKTRDAARDLALEAGDSLSIPIVNQVYVTGEVRGPGKVPYDPGLRVSDYIIASGGVNPLTADPNAIWFVDKLGGKTRAGLDSAVAPGAIIFVDQNTWTKTQVVLADIGVVTSFISALALTLTYALSAWNAIPK